MHPIAVFGPTASGKSALGLALAHELDGEVVNVDSMQLYRGMDIGTAKLTPAEREAAARAGAAEFVVEDGVTGVLTPPGDADALAASASATVIGACRFFITAGQPGLCARRPAAGRASQARGWASR